MALRKIQVEEKREYFRIQCPHSICTKMTVAKVGEKVVYTNSRRVCVEDIGPGGVRFLTNLELPVRADILYEFEMKLHGDLVSMHGYIRRKRAIEQGVYEYGVEFEVSDLERSQVVMLLNDFNLQIHRRFKLDRTAFCEKNKLDCLCVPSLQDDRRQYFRIHCPKPICSAMEIVKINHKEVKSGKKRVCIKDISEGGLCFLSTLKLPSVPGIEVEFQISVLEKILHVSGQLMWKKEVEKDIFEYGVKFIQSGTKGEELRKVLNELAHFTLNSLRQEPQIFCQKDTMECLRSKK